MRILLTIIARFYREAYQLRLSLRSRQWRRRDHVTAHNANNLLMTGFFDEVLGIGRAGNLTLEALRSAGHEVKIDNLRSSARHLLTRAAIALPIKKGGIWIVHANAPEAELALFVYDHQDWQDCYRITYWAWETTLAPASWVRAARYFHEIWVPSPFVRDALKARFEQAGEAYLCQALKVVPHPISPKVPVRRDRQRWGLAPEVFVGLVMFDGRSGYERKNPHGAIEVWCHAFVHPSAHAQLIIKCHHASADPKAYARLRSAVAARSDISLWCEEMEAEDVDSLIGAVDVMLSLHRAEGFGLCLAEAMMMGTPVLATAWSGNMVFMEGIEACLVPYHLIPARVGDGQWAEPDTKLAAAKLRRFFEDRGWHGGISQQVRQHMLAKAKAWRDVIEKTVAPRDMGGGLRDGFDDGH